AGSLLLYDALEMSFQTVRLRKNPTCKVCGSHPTVTELIDYEEFCGVPTRGRDEVDLEEEYIIFPGDLAQRLSQDSTITLVDVREESELEISRIPGAKLIPLGQLAGRVDELDRGK